MSYSILVIIGLAFVVISFFIACTIHHGYISIYFAVVYFILLSIYSLSFSRVEVIETKSIVYILEELEEAKKDKKYIITFSKDVEEPILETVRYYGLGDIIYISNQRIVLPYPED